MIILRGNRFCLWKARCNDPARAIPFEAGRFCYVAARRHCSGGCWVDLIWHSRSLTHATSDPFVRLQLRHYSRQTQLQTFCQHAQRVNRLLFIHSVCR